MRRASRQVNIGGVVIGGDAPVAIQSMTNTKTEDVAATSSVLVLVIDWIATGASPPITTPPIFTCLLARLIGMLLI